MVNLIALMNFQTRISKVKKLEDGIIRVEFFDNSEMRASDLDELMSLCKEMIPTGEKAFFLNVFPENISGDFEFGRISADHEINKLRKAQAIVIKNIPQRIQSAFYKNFFSLGFPLKIFNDELSAVSWLHSLNPIETSISTIQKIDDMILRIKVKNNVIIDEKGLKENLEIYQRLLPDGGYFLILFNDSNTADKTAKIPFEAFDRVKLKKGEAFVIENLAHRIELEYYINKTKKLYPTKVFELEEEAIAFLNELKSN